MSRFIYLGKGSIFMKDRAGGNFLPVGNVPQLSLSAEEVKTELPDFENPGGGIVASVSRISRVVATVTFNDLRKSNLEFLLRGSSSSVTSSAVSGETHTSPGPGGYVKLDNMVDTSQTVTITGLTAGSDFKVLRGGIYFPDTSSTNAGDTLSISYTSAAGSVVEALTAGGKEFTLVFDGLNEAESNRPVIVTLHRVKPAPFQNLSLIGEDFAAIDIEIDVLKDDAITGAGVSQYFKVEVAN